MELETKDLTELAILCGKVAGKPSTDRETVKRAYALRLEWVRLQRLPIPALEEQPRAEAQQQSLKKRMAEFLVAAL
jgi:hypothetical protein